MNSAPHSHSAKPAHPLAHNRRRGNRHRLHIPATLIADDAKVPHIEVTVTEVSIGGVGFKTSAQLEVGAVFQLTSFDTLLPPGMRVKIVSCLQANGGGYKVGAETLQALHDENENT